MENECSICQKIINSDKLLETKKFLELLEDNDDVQKVYSNLETLG